ncbi:signal-regulatory protein beta-2-like [Myripristis murdjan]|uniref:signal-regulatory protein beta-2-like n=1 Tax=Myripristis murdjan TaxID=586833 RepID=UPI00117608EA|nr:signal-regulatory protein beta-2-like [Myripristis murdjan]
MLLVFCMLFVLSIGRCTDDQNFTTVTAHVGENVTLTCMRHDSSDTKFLFWIRLVAGNFPEVLGRTFSFPYISHDGVARITAKQEPGKFVLHITKTQLSDTAIYYCIKVYQIRMTFLNGTFLRIKDSEPNITVVTQVFPSEPVYEGDPVTLQCSLLSDSENKACPAEHSVFWFRAGSDESHPRMIYTHGNWGDGCEKSPEAGSPPQSCVYSFSKNSVSSSDAGTYYCAVATCGEILFGKGAKLDIEGKGAKLDIKVSATRRPMLFEDEEKVRQRVADTLVYSAVMFTRRTNGNSRMRKRKTAEAEAVHAAVRTRD